VLQMLLRYPALNSARATGFSWTQSQNATNLHYYRRPTCLKMAQMV